MLKYHIFWTNALTYICADFNVSGSIMKEVTIIAPPSDERFLLHKKEHTVESKTDNEDYDLLDD